MRKAVLFVVFGGLTAETDPDDVDGVRAQLAMNNAEEKVSNNLNDFFMKASL
jgi:hypothetical protein